MVRVLLEDADYCDVTADLMTFDAGVIVFWKDGEEVARHRQGRIHALEVLSTGGRRIGEARKNFPNAYRPWTTDQEELLTKLHAGGASLDELTAELGRQPGGIEARLRHLGLLADDERLR